MGKVLDNEEMIVFCSQMAKLLKAGISPFEGISMLLEDQKNEEGRKILQQIYDSMSMGESLYTGMEHTKVFPAYAMQMILLGETSGRLDDVMQDLKDYYQQEDDLFQTVKRSVSYPLFMLIMMLGVLLVLMIRVMPVFQSVFVSLGTAMTGPAGAVLNMGMTMSRYSGLFIGLLVVIFGLFLWTTRTAAGKERAMTVLQKSRFMHQFMLKTGQYRLASGMAMCIRSGLDAERSLELMTGLVDNEQISGRLKECAALVNQGMFFEDAVVEKKLFTDMQNRMIKIGQKSGSVDQVMSEIAGQCRNEASEIIWNRIGMIEPTVVIVLAVLVGLILLSVMLPLMSIMTQIG